MVVRDFHDNFGRDWFPLASPLGAPAAWPSGRVPGEPGRFFQCFKFVRYRPAFRSFESGNKSDVMEQTIFSVEAEQKRTDYALASRVTKSADHTIGCADLLHLDRCGALPRSVRSIKPFGDNAIKIATGSLKPFIRSVTISGRRR